MNEILTRLFSIITAVFVIFSNATSNESNIPELTEQMLEVKNISNARQLGGYRTTDGRQVKDKILIRSGALSGASEEDIAILTDVYELSTIIDLRTAKESTEDPDPIIDGVTYYSLPFNSEDSIHQQSIIEIYRVNMNDPGLAFVEMVRGGALSSNDSVEYFLNPDSLLRYREFFDLLLAHEDGAILWHCTGGKDRTGLASAMVLTLLGVEKETVIADFALTNEVNRARIEYVVNAARKYTDDQNELDQVAALVGVSVAQMTNLFEYGEAQSGTMADFIKETVGITDEEVELLKEKFLE